VVAVTLPDSRFWGQDGRIGVITRGEWKDRLALFYPDLTPGHWTCVVSSSPVEGPLDYYIISDEYAENVIEEYGIIWLARSPEEVALEERVFGWRATFDKPSGFRGWFRRVFGAIE
jgi:hypothetical protein